MGKKHPEAAGDSAPSRLPSQGCPQFGRASSRVLLHLRLLRSDNFPPDGQPVAVSRGPAGALRLRAEGVPAGEVVAAQEALDQPVLQRVEGDDAEPPAGTQQPPGRPQARVQLVQLVVDEDAQRLEGLGGHVRGPLESVSARVSDGSRKRPWRWRRRS